MKSDCTQWKDRLPDVTLSGMVPGELAEHLQNCAGCKAELDALCARREQLDSLLPLVAQGAEPSVEFRARVLAATESVGGPTRRGQWRIWQQAGALAMIVAALIISLTLYRRGARTVPQAELVGAQRLAEWRAPSDVLLQTPGREILGTMPRLGESYFGGPAKSDKEE